MECAGRAQRRRRFRLSAALQLKRYARIQPCDCQLTPTHQSYGVTGALGLRLDSVSPLP